MIDGDEDPSEPRRCRSSSNLINKFNISVVVTRPTKSPSSRRGNVGDILLPPELPVRAVQLETLRVSSWFQCTTGAIHFLSS